MAFTLVSYLPHSEEDLHKLSLVIEGDWSLQNFA